MSRGGGHAFSLSVGPNCVVSLCSALFEKLSHVLDGGLFRNEWDRVNHFDRLDKGYPVEDVVGAVLKVGGVELPSLVGSDEPDCHAITTTSVLPSSLKCLNAVS